MATQSNRTQSTRTKTQAKRTQTNAKRTANSAKRTASTASRQATPEKNQVRKVAETAVDVPVGVVLNASERVQEIVDPWTDRATAERQLRSYRTQLTRTLKRAERRGATARRKATTQAKRTRTRVEREVRRVEREARQRQRKAATTVRQNRRKAETTLRRNRRQAEKQLRRSPGVPRRSRPTSSRSWTSRRPAPRTSSVRSATRSRRCANRLARAVPRRGGRTRRELPAHIPRRQRSNLSSLANRPLVGRLVLVGASAHPYAARRRMPHRVGPVRLAGHPCPKLEGDAAALIVRKRI